MPLSQNTISAIKTSYAACGDPAQSIQDNASAIVNDLKPHHAAAHGAGAALNWTSLINLLISIIPQLIAIFTGANPVPVPPPTTAPADTSAATA